MIVDRSPASRRLARVALVAAAVVALSGCTSVRGWFAGKDSKKAAKPTELTTITPTLNVAQLWRADVGGGEGRLGLRQGPVVDGGRVYAAAVKGGVYALDLQTGKAAWHY
ncbi:outer membrane protein assembly factor BamB family protein, partial [Lysobacter xanthus]